MKCQNPECVSENSINYCILKKGEKKKKRESKEKEEAQTNHLDKV